MTSKKFTIHVQGTDLYTYEKQRLITSEGGTEDPSMCAAYIKDAESGIKRGKYSFYSLIEVDSFTGESKLLYHAKNELKTRLELNVQAKTTTTPKKRPFGTSFDDYVVGVAMEAPPPQGDNTYDPFGEWSPGVLPPRQNMIFPVYPDHPLNMWEQGEPLEPTMGEHAGWVYQAKQTINGPRNFTIGFIRRITISTATPQTGTNLNALFSE